MAPMKRWCGLAVAVLCLPGCFGGKGAQTGVPKDAQASRGGSERAPGGEAQAATTWEQPAVPGSAVLLRLKRPVGKTLIYEASQERRQEGANKVVETGQFYLTFTNLGPTASGGLDQVAIVRSYLDRSRKVTLKNKKVVDELQPNSTEYVNLGPNFETVGRQRCYAFNAQNNVGNRAEDLVLLKDGRQLRGTVLKRDNDEVILDTPQRRERFPRAAVSDVLSIPTPHVLLGDSPHYLFPIFRKTEVAPGDSWTFKVPVIIPCDAGKDGVPPTQFDLRMTGRLREVRGEGAEREAVVDYVLAGAFDSQAKENAGRFPAEFHQTTRIQQSLDGKGVARINLAQGRILEKLEDVSMVWQLDATTPQPGNQPPKKEQERSEMALHFQMRLLLPGTKLRNGEEVPENE